MTLSKIKINDELKDEANKYPGFTYCEESCGCATCGCFLCSSGCLFYRVYAKPVSNFVYEVFSCPKWEYEIDVIAKINLGNEHSQEAFSLRPGSSVEWKNLELSVPSVSLPPLPLLGSQFLRNGEEVFLVKASASGHPVAGTIGQLQCANKEKAAKFDCFLPHNPCQCQSRETQVACVCNDQILETLTAKEEHVLPIVTQGLSIFDLRETVSAQIHSFVALELQVDLKGFKLVSKIQKNSCYMNVLKFSGCYNCITGAKLEYVCRTNFGEALAEVNCGNIKFVVSCTVSGFTASTVLNFQNANVNETCYVKCPESTSKFLLNGMLAYIEKEKFNNVSNIIAAGHAAATMDYQIFSDFFKNNWVKTIIVVIVGILLAIATIVLFPFIVSSCQALANILPRKAVKFKKKNRIKQT